MADEVAATIRVSGDRSDGNVSGSSNSIFKEMVNELKSMTGLLSKAEALGRAGIGGGATAGLLSKLLGGFGTGALALGGLAAYTAQADPTTDKDVTIDQLNLGRSAGFGDTENAAFEVFEKINVEGEDFVAKIDQKSGQILEVLTLQQAKDEGILDDKGKIKKSLDTTRSIFDVMTKNVKKQGDAVVLELDELDKITTLSEDEVFLKQQIIELLHEKRRKLEKETGKSATTPSEVLSVIEAGASSAAAEAAFSTESNQIMATKEQIWENVPQNKAFFDLTNLFQ